MEFSSDSNAFTSSSSQTASLPSDAAADMLTPATPTRRRGKSMSRRVGQNGNVFVKSKFGWATWATKAAKIAVEESRLTD